MSSRPRIAQLDYLAEYRLGTPPTAQRRNVALIHDRYAQENWEILRSCNFPWHLARKYEDRLGSPISEGVWPIDNSRFERSIGNPGTVLYPSKSNLSIVNDTTLEAALKGRTLCYFRVTT